MRLCTNPESRPPVQTKAVNGQGERPGETSVVIEEDGQWDEDADAPYDEDVYDDTGTGNGVEGDLEMDDD